MCVQPHFRNFLPESDVTYVAIVVGVVEADSPLYNRHVIDN